MEFFLTTDVENKLREYKKKEPTILKKIQKQLHYFCIAHLHPCLRTHKLKGHLSDTWRISINESVRMLYYIEGDRARFFLIGTHDEDYR